MIVSRLFGIKLKHSGMNAADLISTGSLLDWADSAVRGERPIVWGSGFIEDGPPYSGGELDVRAVRGRLSLERLPLPAGRRVAMGDPGLLTALAVPRPAESARAQVGIVPHFTHLNHPTLGEVRKLQEVQVIDVREPVRVVIRRITACDLIISSSLHGLIVAESYGIPNLWCRLGEGPIGGDYKFVDYYSAFGVRASSVDLLHTLSHADEVRSAWRPLPGLRTLQRELVKAFPLPLVRDRQSAHRL